MEAIRSSETSILVGATRRHISEEGILHVISLVFILRCCSYPGWMDKWLMNDEQEGISGEHPSEKPLYCLKMCLNTAAFFQASAHSSGLTLTFPNSAIHGLSSWSSVTKYWGQGHDWPFRAGTSRCPRLAEHSGQITNSAGSGIHTVVGSKLLRLNGTVVTTDSLQGRSRYKLTAPTDVTPQFSSPLNRGMKSRYCWHNTRSPSV
jgi:hypothetical protein